VTDIDKDIMEFLNEQARSEDEGAKICRYAGKLLAMSQARSAKLRAAAERIRVLGEEVEAARRCLTDAALTTPEYNAERNALAYGSAMPDDYNVIGEYTEARAATDATRRGA